MASETLCTTFETSLEKINAKTTHLVSIPICVRANATSIKFVLKKVSKTLSLNLKLYQDIRK